MDIIQKKNEITSCLEKTNYSIFNGNKNLGITTTDYQIATIQDSVKTLYRNAKGAPIAQLPMTNITKIFIKRIKEAIDQLNNITKRLNIEPLTDIDTNDNNNILMIADDIAKSIDMT